MGIFQEAAIMAGDLVTQPIRKIIAEKITGYRFKIVRKHENKYTLDDFKNRRQKYKVSWKLESLGKIKQSKPNYNY